jgi:hypothetical protein
MSIYAHRQPGAWTLRALCASAVLSAALTAGLAVQGSAVAFAGAAVLAVTAACAWMFRSLTVEVTEREIRCRFAAGPVRKTIPLAQVRAARAVRNPWWYGWGVRLTPRGWMYNISGLDAVEVELRDGRRFRIGTDEPQALARAIERALALR